MNDHFAHRSQQATSAETGQGERETQPCSPCVGTCRIDPDDGLCVGCFRNLDEICNWLMLSDEQKLALMTCCEKRRKDRQKD